MHEYQLQIDNYIDIADDIEEDTVINDIARIEYINSRCRPRMSVLIEENFSVFDRYLSSLLVDFSYLGYIIKFRLVCPIGAYCQKSFSVLIGSIVEGYSVCIRDTSPKAIQNDPLHRRIDIGRSALLDSN